MIVDNNLIYLFTICSLALNTAFSSLLDQKLTPADYKVCYANKSKIFYYYNFIIVHMFFVKVSGLSKFGLVDETYAGYLPIHKHTQLVLIISTAPHCF